MKYAVLVYGFSQSIILCLEDCAVFLTVNSAQLETNREESTDEELPRSGGSVGISFRDCLDVN